MTYRVVEVFRTLQGEGAHAGRAAVFVRFAACNLWSGEDEHRERDAARHGAECPRWCDTDFRTGHPYDLGGLVMEIARLASGGVELIVLTGGEPLLQVNSLLTLAIKAALPGCIVAVETNGTRLIPLGIDWVCLSPKVPPDRIVLVDADEVKVVFPDYDPLAYGHIEATHRFVQPRAETSRVGRSLISADNTERAAAFCAEHPKWRLGMQAHKVWGLP